MSRHSIEPIDFIFVKGDGFLSFAKKMGTDISVSVSKSLSRKYSLGIGSCVSKTS